MLILYFLMLKSCFITLYNSVLGASVDTLPIRDWNYFWSPMASEEQQNNAFLYNSAYEFDSCYIQIGSKLFPEYPIRSHAKHSIN
jgi:hypothetical protein